MTLLVTAALVFGAPAAEGQGCTRADFHRVAAPVYRSESRVTDSERRRVQEAIYCLRRKASRRIARMHLRRYKAAHRVRRAWAYYKAHPMPYCTWANESGHPKRYPEWPPSRRYWVPNSEGSGAFGKYQIMPDTWAGNGGGSSWAPLEQERVARNVLASQGIGAWSGCH